jgi:predicted nucleotidyltransferase
MGVGLQLNPRGTERPHRAGRSVACYVPYMERELPLPLREPLHALKRRLEARFGERLREVRLFGSWARGEQTASSDVDVLVVIDRMTSRDRFDVVEEVTPVLLASRLDLCALPLGTEPLDALRAGERLLAAELDRDGIPV